MSTTTKKRDFFGHSHNIAAWWASVTVCSTTRLHCFLSFAQHCSCPTEHRQFVRKTYLLQAKNTSVTSPTELPPGNTANPFCAHPTTTRRFIIYLCIAITTFSIFLASQLCCQELLLGRLVLGLVYLQAQAEPGYKSLEAIGESLLSGSIVPGGSSSVT